MQKPPIVEIKNLVFDYPDFRALRGISVIIPRHSVTALVGPNGAGKTTLLRCIAGLETAVAGEVVVNGLSVRKQPREVHRIMGYLPDHFGLYSDLTVQQCLQYAARSQGLAPSAVGDAVNHTLARMGLSEKLHHRAGSLSRGQRQRLAIGQSIIHQPQVLLLDEPASGLDPEARADLAQLFTQLRNDGMSLLVSSHILAELDAYSTHMLALNQGQVLELRELSSAVASAEHRGQQPQRLHYRLRLLSAQEPALQWLNQHPLVDELAAVGSDGLEFFLRGGPEEMAAVIRGLVIHGHDLVAAEPVQENLQASYLRSLRNQRLGEQHNEAGAL